MDPIYLMHPTDEDFNGETEEKYPRNQSKSDRYNVEDCLKLTIGRLRHKSTWISGITNPQRRYRSCTLANGSWKATLLYTDLTVDQDTLTLVYDIGDKIERVQTLRLVTVPIRFGLRRFWLCRCGYRATTLYLCYDRPDLFACKSCLNLRYRLTTINRNAACGEFFYRESRVMKLMAMREDISRIDYNGKLTRKAAAFMAASEKWKINEEVNEKMNRQIKHLQPA